MTGRRLSLLENRSYFYPSVSGSFVFTELIPKNDILSFGKIRASWAQVGKDADAYATNTYLWRPEAVSGSFVGNGNSWTGGSPNLLPEIQTSFEIGTELKFLKGRLGLDFTYYNSITKNQLASPRLCPVNRIYFPDPKQWFGTEQGYGTFH